MIHVMIASRYKRANIIKHELELRVTSYELQVQLHELRVQIHELQVQIY